MPYYIERPVARRVEQWDGENIDLMRELAPGYFDFYDIDPDTGALTANDTTYEVGTLLWNYGGSIGVADPDELSLYFQQVNKERPAFVIDADDLGAASLRK